MVSNIFNHGNPGDDYNCRCTAERYYGNLPAGSSVGHMPYDPPIEPVYPEQYIIPALRIPRLIVAWRAWQATRAARLLRRDASENWRLGDYKSPTKWANQMEEGNWTPDKIGHFIKNGEKHPATNYTVTPNTPATRYQINDEYVVVDDITNEIIQITRPRKGGFIPKKFVGHTYGK